MNPVSPPAVWPYDPSDRVMLGWKGLVVGILVADIVFFLSGTLPSVVSRPNYAGYTLTMMAMAMVVGLAPIGAVGIVVAWPLEKALRRVRNQWIHIAAFFAAGALICVPFGGFWNSQSWAYPLSIAVAAGIGRLSIWKLVRINDQPSIS